MGVRLPRTGARFLSPKRLAFRTFGSGSCPSLPTRLKALAPNAVRFDLVAYDPRRLPCTTDLRSTTVEVAVDPSRINVRRSLTIELVYSPGRRHVRAIAPPLA
jgi:hypothetical protein